MSQSDYMTPSRTNNFITSNNISLPHPVHLFTHQQTYSPLMTLLKSQFQKKNVIIQYHDNPNQLSLLLKRSSEKIFIIIDTLKSNKQSSNPVFPEKFTFPKIKDNKVKIICTPNKIPKTDYDTMTSPSQIVSSYQKFFLVNESSKIKLRSVHKSKDVKYQLASPQKLLQMKKSSKQVFFQKLLYNDYKVVADSDFKILTDSIKTAPNTFVVLSFSELKKMVDGMKDVKGSKMLFLVEDKMLKQYREFIEKNKLSQKLQIIVFGDLKPSRQLLKDNVYLATDNPEVILSELEKLKFQKIENCRSELIRLASSKKNRFRFSQQSLKNIPLVNQTPQVKDTLQLNSNQLASRKTQQKGQMQRLSERSGASFYSLASSQAENYLRTWIVDLDPTANDKRYAKYLITEQGKQQIEIPSERLSRRARLMRRSSSQSTESIFTNSLNTFNDEAFKMKKAQDLATAEVNITMPNELQFPKVHISHQQHKVKQSLIQVPDTSNKSGQNKKLLIVTKKQPGENKHITKHQQMPSNIIPQMSQQYRGSHLQSIVNMDDYFFQHSRGDPNVGNNNNISQSMVANFSKMKNSQPIAQSTKVLNNKMTINTSVNQNSMNNGKVQSLEIKEIAQKNGQQLPIEPIDSPKQSQVTIKERLIDGLTGQLIGFYDEIDEMRNKNQQNLQKFDKKIFETITVTPYEPASMITKQTHNEHTNAYSYQQKNISRNQPVNLVQNNEVKITQYETIKSQPYQPIRSQPQLKQQTSQKIITIHQEHRVIKPLQQIQPQIVKIPISSSSIDNEISRQSLPTDKMIQVVNNTKDEQSYSGSLTSIKEQSNYNFGIVKVNQTQTIGGNANNLGYGKEYISTNTYENKILSTRDLGYAQRRNTDNNVIRYESTKTSQGQSPTTTVSYNPYSINNYSSTTKATTTPIAGNNSYTVSSSANYKVYTPEEYAAKYGAKATENVLSPGRKQYTSSSSNNYQYNYNSTTSKQPEVINRVYIKASDLPQRTGNVITNNYTANSTFTKRVDPYTSTTRVEYTSPSKNQSSNNINYIVHQPPKQLTVDQDPFFERASKVSQRRGSYMLRKQDGVRDHFSPYEESGSHIQVNSGLRKQKSTIRTNPTIQNTSSKKMLSPIRQQIKTTNQTITVTNYQQPAEYGIGISSKKIDPSYEKPQTLQRITLMQTQSKVIEPPSRDYSNQSSQQVIKVSGVTRYEPSGRNYANSPTRRQGASYEKGITSQNPLRRPSQQSLQKKTIIPLKTQNIKPLVYDSRSPLKVSQYKSLEPQRQRTTYTYSSPTRHIYERKEQTQPRVITDQKNEKQKNETQQRKKIPKGPQQQIGVISGIKPRNSEILQLSDGSIMRRNNIKFGINKHKAQQQNQQTPKNANNNSIEYLDQIKSQISRPNRVSEIKNGQFYTLQKKYQTEKEVNDEKQAYSYINTSVNEFYFLVDEDLTHINLWLNKYLKTKNDFIDKYRGMEQLYEKLKIEKERNSYDVTLIFAKKEDLNKINKNLLFQDAYIVEVLGDQFKGLQISQKQHKVKLSKLPYLKLVQKVIVETLLTHVILYQKSMENNENSQSHFTKQVAHILSLFPEGHFIKQSYTPPLTSNRLIELIDDPKFTRLYIICNEKQMTHVSNQIHYTSEQSMIPQEIFKLICIPSDNEILKYQSKIESHPKVAWMTNASQIGDYRSLIKYAMRQQEDQQMYNVKPENQERQKIFYHIRHKNLVPIIEKEFPSRFQFDSYASMNQVQRKIFKNKNDMKSKQIGIKFKDSMSPLGKRPSFVTNKTKNSVTQHSNSSNIVNYLILHPVASDEFVDTKLFKKVFLLGKSQKTQRKVVKVSTNEELLQLLKK